MARRGDTYTYEKSYDIVNRYDWTSVPRGSRMRCEAPAAYITAYKLKYSQLRAFIDGYLNILDPANINRRTLSAKPGLDFYRGLYATNTEPITRLNLPFFGDDVRSFTSEFQDTFTPVSQRGARMLGAEFIEGLAGSGERLLGGGTELVRGVAQSVVGMGGKSLIDKIAKSSGEVVSGLGKGLGLQGWGKHPESTSNPGTQTVGAPGSYIETPKFYQYSNTDNGLELSFALSNTINDGAIDQNYKFIKDFTRMNRPFRTGAIGMTFPAIYSLVIPGLRYMQWASLENFSVSLIGSRRRLVNPSGKGSRVIPEAYSCSFKFKSLTIEAANFMDEIEEFGSFQGCEGGDSYFALKEKEERLMADMASTSEAAAANRGIYSTRFRPGKVGNAGTPSHTNTRTETFGGIQDTYGGEFLPGTMAYGQRRSEDLNNDGRPDYQPNLANFAFPGARGIDGRVISGTVFNPETGMTENVYAPQIQDPNTGQWRFKQPFDDFLAKEQDRIGPYTEDNPGPTTYTYPDGAPLPAELQATANNARRRAFATNEQQKADNAAHKANPAPAAAGVNPDYDRSKGISADNPIFKNLGTNENIPMDN